MLDVALTAPLAVADGSLHLLEIMILILDDFAIGR
jgi:hypothetical protein